MLAYQGICLINASGIEHNKIQDISFGRGGKNKTSTTQIPDAEVPCPTYLPCNDLIQRSFPLLSFDHKSNIFIIYFYLRAYHHKSMSRDANLKIINDYCYSAKDKIGKGSSSEVFRGINQKTGQEVAVKVMSLAQQRKDSLLSVASSQVELLTKLKRQAHIIQIKTAIKTKNHFYIITELCQQGTLQEFIAKNKQSDEKAAVEIISQIIKGYGAISNKGFIHRDLKPSNIFQQGGVFKIGDLGYAIQESLCRGGPLDQNVGSPRYMPLESLEGNMYSFKSDIWAIGLIFLELLTGRTPWKSKSEPQLIVELKQFEPKGVVPRYVSNNARMFLERALTRQVQKRMSLYEMLNWDFSDQRKCTKMGFTLTNSLSKQVERLKSKAKRPSKNAFKTQTSITMDFSSPSTPTKHSQASTCLSFTQAIQSQAGQCSPPKQIASRPPCKSQYATNQAIKLNQSVQDLSANKQSQHVNNIASQLQAQISYLSFILKMFKKLAELFKTNDPKIHQFKCSLLSLAYSKINEVRDLKFVKGVTSADKKAFLDSSVFQGLEAVMTKYEQKCVKESKKHTLNAIQLKEREFMKVLSYVMDLLYGNVQQLKTNKAELQKKKHLIFILEDLIAFSSLFLLEREEHWLHFMDKSNINTLLLKASPKEISPEYLIDIEAKFLDLTHS